MADSKTHIQAGLITGAALSILKDWNRTDLTPDQKMGRALLWGNRRK